MLEAPEHFLEDVFLTQSDALGGMLTDQLTRVTKRIIREEDAREINDRIWSLWATAPRGRATRSKCGLADAALVLSSNPLRHVFNVLGNHMNFGLENLGPLAAALHC
jgi:hypothetical protein